LIEAHPLSAVLRFRDIVISQQALSGKLGVTLDRFSPERSGDLFWAQINLPECRDSWQSIKGHIATLASPIAELITSGAIGSATLDLAFSFDSKLITRSAKIPKCIVEAAGRGQLDLEISTYPSTDNDTADPVQKS